MRPSKRNFVFSKPTIVTKRVNYCSHEQYTVSCMHFREREKQSLTMKALRKTIEERKQSRTSWRQKRLAVQQEQVKEQSVVEEEEEEEEEEEDKQQPQIVEEQKQDDKDDEKRASKWSLWSRDQVIARLRELNEPATLFGELDRDRVRRLERAELLAASGLDFAISGGENDFRKALKELDELRCEETDMEERVRARHLAREQRISEYSRMLRDADTAFACAEQRVAASLRKLLDEWERYVDAQMADIAEMSGGVNGRLSAVQRQDAAVHKQTVGYMESLFDLLDRRQLEASQLDAIDRIVKAIDARQYREAHDAYMSMAIGNAPWPLGATMTSIHSRSAREKIFAKNVAHVLNDEQQRKYIQSIKRLITFAERLRPAGKSHH
jgi:pre-mRNA-splicing factor 18